MPIINQDQLLPEEKDSGVSQSHSILSGLASGLIQIPKGGFSLALNLYDLGAGTDTALHFENFVDKINPFKEDAEATLAGKMSETLANLVVPSTYGFKLSSNLAKSAIEAKKAGTYFKLNNKALTEAGNVAAEGNKAANLIKFGPTISKLSDAERVKSFVAGAIGAGLSDAAFVGDVKNIGTLGDIFGGPTELDRSEEYDPARELINRVKFGTESALFTGLMAGTGSTISKLRDRNWMANPDSKLDQFFAPIVYGLRPGGADPAEVFKLKLQKLNNIKGDYYVAKQTIDSMFPDVKNILNSQTSEQRKETLNVFNDLLLSGKPEANEVGVFNFGKISDDVREQAINKLKEIGASEQNINNVVSGLEKTRETWNSMFNTIGKDFTPKQFNNFKTIVGDQFKDYLGPTFSIFENKSLIPYSNYGPAKDAVNKLKESFKNTALEKGVQLTDEQLNFYVDSLLKGTKNTLKVTNPTLSLPNFMIKNSMADDALKLEKTFLSELPEQNRKVIEEYLGKKNPFETILNGTTKLSEITRRNEMFQEMKKSGIVFGKDNLEEAAKTFGVAIEDLKPIRFNGVKSLEAASTNPLQNLYTRADIAKSLSDVFDPGPSSLFGQMASKVYNNLILLPKFASQTAATVLNPFVQLKQLLSNISFSTANGIIPKFNELSELRSIFASPEKKEFLIRNGLWNTNAFMGDLASLGKDVGLTKDITGSLNFNNIFDKFFNGASRVKAKAEELYSGADNIFKGLNFIGERNRLAQAYEKYGIQKTAKEIEQEAVDIVRNTVQNYQMVGDVVKSTRKLPIGSFSSYPSEVLRTGTNIVDRAIYEITYQIKNNKGEIIKPLADIGYRRLTGMMATTLIQPAAMVAAGQVIYNVSNDELDAIKRFVPDWSKNSTIIPIKDKETGELKYVDWSHFNAYDTLYRPIQGAFNEVALGKNDHRGIMGNFIKGLASSTKDIMSPFVSQSIYTQALGDAMLSKDGRASDGKVIYNPEDTYGSKFQKSMLHVASSLMPFGAPQWKRLGLSLYPTDSEGRFDKYGNTYELGDELQGIAGLRAIKLDIPKNLGFKVSQFQKDADNARRLFTSETLLGGPITPEDMVDSYINANRALYGVKSELYNDLNAAKALNISSQDLSRSTARLSKNDLSNLNNGIFSPLKISKDVEKLFAQNAERLGLPNSYQEARSVIDSIRQALSTNPLSNGVFPKIPNPFKNLPKPTLGPVSNLPSTPVSATTANSGTMDLHPVVAGQQVNPATKLTENETALLSPTDQLIRQRQRQQQ